MTKKSLLASLLVVVCLGLTAHAGSASRFSYLFDLNPLNRGRHPPLPAPADVVKQGAAFYSLTAFNKRRVTMALFDAAGRPLADISLLKSGTDGPARARLLFYRGLGAQRFLFPRLQRVPQRRHRLHLY